MGAIGEDKYSQQDLDKQNSTVVLIVDDDENIVELLTLYFEKRNIIAYIAVSMAMKLWRSSIGQIQMWFY